MRILLEISLDHGAGGVSDRVRTELSGRRVKSAKGRETESRVSNGALLERAKVRRGSFISQLLP